MQRGISERNSSYQHQANVNKQYPESQFRQSLQPDRQVMNTNLQALSQQFQKQIQNNEDVVQVTEQEVQETKFTFTVPAIVDPDPITCIIEQTDELGGVYLGNFEAAQNIDLLRKLKIRAVLTSSIETGLNYSEQVIHFHEVFRAHDKENYEILQHFDQAYEFIDRNRKFTNVFVHCFLGVSRSASLVIAYIMRKYAMGFEKAMWKVKSKRRQVNPNLGFTRQLQQYEQTLQNKQKQLMDQKQPNYDDQYQNIALPQKQSKIAIVQQHQHQQSLYPLGILENEYNKSDQRASLYVKSSKPNQYPQQKQMNVTLPRDSITPNTNAYTPQNMYRQPY